MAPHSSTLAWKIPWTEEPGGLQSMGSLRFGHDWATSVPLFTFIHWRRKWQRTPVFLPGESQGRGGAWWAAVYGVAQSQTRLKRLSSSSSSTAWILMNQSRYSNQSEKMSFVNNQHRIYRNQLRFKLHTQVPPFKQTWTQSWNGCSVSKWEFSFTYSGIFFDNLNNLGRHPSIHLSKSYLRRR